MEEAGAGVLGVGIVDGGEIVPVEGTETVGISHRTVSLSAGDGTPRRKTAYDWFNRPVLSRFSRIDRGSTETALRMYDNVGLEALVNMSHE